MTDTLDYGFVHIWIVKLDDWHPYISKLVDLLSDSEHERALRLKVKDKKDQLILSRGILRIILASYLEIKPESVQIFSTTDGKPYLEKSKISFNLSHSGNLLLCGLTEKSLFGIDIQEIYPISNLQTIINNYLSEKEKQYLESQTSEQLSERFFSIWTAKEAYLKAIGIGFQKSPTLISTLPEISSNTFNLDDIRSLDESQNWTISSVEVDQDYKAAFAINGNLDGMKIIPFKPEDHFQYDR